MTELNAWKTLMEERFPLRTDDDSGTLEFVDGDLSEDGSNIRATIRLVRWDVSDGERRLHNVKEQEGDFGRAENLQYLDRYAEFLRALEDAFRQFGGETIDTAMPVDFVPVDVLELKARSREEFLEAMMVKSRLGGLLDDQ
jgi:hypothetical protein